MVLCLQCPAGTSYLVSPCFTCPLFHGHSTWNILCLLLCKSPPGLGALNQTDSVASCLLSLTLATLPPAPGGVCGSSRGFGQGCAAFLQVTLLPAPGPAGQQGNGPLPGPVEAQRSEQSSGALHPALAPAGGLFVPSATERGAACLQRRMWTGHGGGGAPAAVPRCFSTSKPRRVSCLEPQGWRCAGHVRPPRLGGKSETGPLGPNSRGLLGQGLWPPGCLRAGRAVATWRDLRGRR